MSYTQIIERANIILSINQSNISSLSKIHFISIIKITIDLLHDYEFDNGKEMIQLIKNLEKIHEKFEKYYMYDRDFYFNDYDTNVNKSYLTYINDNKYLTLDDIIIKCLVLEDFFELYNYSKFKIINEKHNFIDIHKIRLIYNNWKKMLK